MNMEKEIFYKFRADVGFCLIFTLPFSFLFMWFDRNAIGTMALHLIITFIGGMALFWNPSPLEKCASYGLSIKREPQQPFYIIKFPLWVKGIVAAALWWGLRYIMAPSSTVDLAMTLTKGWR